MTITSFEGKHIAVLGFGVEGQPTVDFLLQHKATVTLLDDQPRSTFDPALLQQLEQRGVTVVCEPTELPTGLDLIIRTPGAKPSHPLLEQARQANIEVTTATNIFFEHCPGTIIGITGTKGKGTTSALLHEMLKADKKKTVLGGNIGTPMLSLLDQVTPETIVVLELSSFQLMDIRYSPHVAVILMITSDHLDYHRDVDEYVDAKSNITTQQSVDDVLVVNDDYQRSNQAAKKTKAHVIHVSTKNIPENDSVYLMNNNLVLRRGETTTTILPAEKVALPGAHNLENAAAAIAAASTLNVSIEAMQQALQSFHGLPHRLELVATQDGIAFYNDSIATTPESTIAAIQAFQQPLVLILGGSGKNADFSQLGELLRGHRSIRAIIGVGTEWPRMKSTFKLPPTINVIEGLTSMTEIVAAARHVAESGDIVLLSPACASFDLFKNYKDRGEQFRNAVNNRAT